MKYGLQEVGRELGLEIGFMFKKESAFDTGIAALEKDDAPLAHYLRQTRAWTEVLVRHRNNLEHTGWKLPKVLYRAEGEKVEPVEPSVSDEPFTSFTRDMLDRLCCFVEEFMAHGLLKHFPTGICLTETPIVARSPVSPDRFAITSIVGGSPAWAITYSGTPFDER